MLSKRLEFTGDSSPMKNKPVNITLDRDLWDKLSELAHKESIAKGRRFPTIHALRLAIKVFLHMTNEEVNTVLRERVYSPTRNTGS
jgi:hypothetical protein